jgi:hypothetical protein
MAIGQDTILAAKANGSAPMQWTAGARPNMLNTRPRSSGGTLSWIKVITNGVENPKLIAPTNNNITQVAQYHGDQANRMRKTP